MFNNSFGHLGSLEVLGNGKTCLFSRNSITQWAEGSLATMAEACRFEDNVFSKGCTCSFEWLEKLSPNNVDELKRTSYCQIDNLMHCFNASTFNALKFSQVLCGESPSLDCKKTQTEKKVEGNFLNPDDLARNREKYEKFLYLIAGGAALLILLVILVFVLRMRCHTKRNEPPSSGGQVQITMSRQAPATVTTMQKGVRTFTGHDRAIVDLALEKLRVKHPPDVFNQVDTYTRKLMTEQLSETEKVLTIGEIVRILDECENIGDDFLAFTDLLYRHLDENSGQTTATVTGAGGDPLYAEPGVMVVTPMTSNLLESESHIYAEPSSAQQPLLKTEYSLPMDRSEQATNVYADPIETQNGEFTRTITIRTHFNNHPYCTDKSKRLVSPYAIGNQLGSSPPPLNLPDVLSRSVGTSKAVSPPTLPPPKLNTFGKNPAGSAEPGPSRGPMPMYSVPQKGSAGGSSRSSPCDQRTPLQRDNSSSSSKSSSNHSGGSDITFKIDDIIDYVDT